MKQRGLQRSYLTQLWQRMPTELPSDSPALVRWTEQHCPDGHALMLESQNAQVASNLTVGNIITTLRLIGQVDWVDLIEPVSRSLQVLRQLPSFCRESELTRQQITRAMEQLARDSQKTERETAASRRCGGPGRARQPARGRRRAHRRLLPDRPRPRPAGSGARPARASAPRSASNWRRWRLPLYIGVIALATLLMVAAGGAPWPTGTRWQTLVALFLLAWPASEAASAFVHRLIAESLKVRPLPRLNFPGGIPPEHRVLVVIPTLLTSAASNRELVQQLEFHWLANRENEAQFALLTDWVDAPQRQPARRRRPAARCAGPAGGAERTLSGRRRLRRRAFCCSTGRAAGAKPSNAGWAGSASAASWSNCCACWPPAAWKASCRWRAGLRLADGIRYVVTLDSDTGLPPGALRELVAIAAHPLNAPQIDTALRRVVGGYGILQPRVVTPLPGPAQDTPYHRLFAGQCGIDPYSSGVSDVYQDLFGTGSFSGKGLLHVQAVHAVLDGRLPQEAVLSHDLLEGSIARCGFVSDVVLVEDHAAPCRRGRLAHPPLDARRLAAAAPDVARQALRH